MESEQRGRASRASSTSSLGREVRCGCQYYQSDSLLPERRALLVRPSSRTMQQPPAVRCRSVSILAHPRVPTSANVETGAKADGGWWMIQGGFSPREIIHSICRPLRVADIRVAASGVGYTPVRKPRRVHRRGYLRFARLAIDRKLRQLRNPPSPILRTTFVDRAYTRVRTAMFPARNCSGTIKSHVLYSSKQIF